MTGCNTGRNIQKYKGAGASTLQDVTDNSNTTTGDIITTSGFFIGDGSKLTGVALSTDLASNSSRISTVSTNLVSNVSRIDDLETEVRPANRGGTGINSYTVGDILYASATDTLNKLPIGNSGEFLKTNGTTISWSAISEVAPATAGTLTANTFQYLTSNNGTFNGSADVTFGVDATTTNTTNKIVARDSNGNVYATEYHGDYLKHTSDTNTHLGFPSNDTFTVTTGGTERLRIDNSGNVGIGESTPTTPLHIECADTSTHYQNGLLVKQSHSSHPAIIGIRTSSTTQDPFISFMVNDDSTGWSYGVDASESNKMKWAYTTTDVSNSTRMTLTNDGKLGIGTTSPGYNLDVDGTMKLTGGLFVNSSYGTIGQVLTSGGGSGNMSWTTVSSGGSSPWTVSGSDIYRSSGKVGIETTTPAYTLDVDGDIRTTSEGGFRGNGRNITGINITSERNQTIINFGQQSSLKKSVNGNPL